MSNFNDALRLSYIFCLAMVALKFDGGGRLELLPVWALILISTLPVVVYGLTNAVMFALARLALFFARR